MPITNIRHHVMCSTIRQYRQKYEVRCHQNIYNAGVFSISNWPEINLGGFWQLSAYPKFCVQTTCHYMYTMFNSLHAIITCMQGRPYANLISTTLPSRIWPLTMNVSNELSGYEKITSQETSRGKLGSPVVDPFVEVCLGRITMSVCSWLILQERGIHVATPKLLDR